MPPIDAIDLDFSGNIVPLPVRDKTSVKIEFRFAPNIKDEVERLIKERIFNFRTASDFYRRAVWNQLLLLKELSPKMGKRINLIELCMEVAEQSERRRELGTGIAYLDREIDALKSAGALEEAKNLAFQAMNVVANSGLDDTCKKEAVKLIRLKHADLLAMGLAPNGHE